MCSVGDDNFEDQRSLNYLPEVDFKDLLVTRCNKCRSSSPCILLRHKDAYCKECFLVATTHKFKAFLGKHRLICPNDGVVVVLKAGHECAALLHLIRSGLDLNTPKKLRFHPLLVYIETHFHLSVAARRKLLESIDQQARIFKFQTYFSSLCDILGKPDPETVIRKLTTNYQELEMSENDSANINKALKDAKNQTQKLQFLKLQEQNLLYIIAKHLKCKHILTPELGSHVAAQLLNSVALGRGVHLALDIGICDNRDLDVNIIRPLRHFETKEIALYNHFNNLMIVSVPVAAKASGSVQDLMRTFIDNLQINYPATITTIVRTGDKLTLDEDLRMNSICSLCKAPIEMPSDDLTSSESTKFSRLVSTCKVANDSLTSVENCTKLMKGFNVEISKYCYSCFSLTNKH